MKKKTTFKYDTQTFNEVELTSNKFLKKAKEFLIDNSNLEEDEILYVVKAFENSDGDLTVDGEYYGADVSPLTFLINSKDYSEHVFLEESISSNALIEYLLSHKKSTSQYNLYLFKVLYKNLKLYEIKSFYGGENDLEFYIFDEYDEELNRYGEVIKRFGRVSYAPSINFYLNTKN